MLLSLTFFFYCYGDHLDLHSFPTRRSSDLGPAALCRRAAPDRRQPGHRGGRRVAGNRRAQPRPVRPRSEEHTSELQSRPHLVCRLLLEKKKKKKKIDTDTPRAINLSTIPRR